MRATITKAGVLVVEPTNDMEAFALRKWAEQAVLYNEDLSQMVVKGEHIVIKLEDDE